MLKAYLVTFSVTVRIIAEPKTQLNGEEVVLDMDIESAFEKAGEYMSTEARCDEAFVECKEDTEVPFMENPDDGAEVPDALVVALAYVFSRKLREMYPVPVINHFIMRKEITLCDPNQVMIDAWTELFGTEPPIQADDNSNEDEVSRVVDITNGAFYRAWKRGFDISDKPNTLTISLNQ